MFNSFRFYNTYKWNKSNSKLCLIVLDFIIPINEIKVILYCILYFIIPINEIISILDCILVFICIGNS